MENIDPDDLVQIPVGGFEAGAVAVQCGGKGYKPLG